MNIINTRNDVFMPAIPLIRRVEQDAERQEQQKNPQQFRDTEDNPPLPEGEMPPLEPPSKEHLLDIMA